MRMPAPGERDDLIPARAPSLCVNLRTATCMFICPAHSRAEGLIRILLVQSLTLFVPFSPPSSQPPPAAGFQLPPCSPTSERP